MTTLQKRNAERVHKRFTKLYEQTVDSRDRRRLSPNTTCGARNVTDSKGTKARARQIPSGRRESLQTLRTKPFSFRKTNIRKTFSAAEFISRTNTTSLSRAFRERRRAFENVGKSPRTCWNCWKLRNRPAYSKKFKTNDDILA